MIEVPSTPWREAPWEEAEARESAPADVAWTALPGIVRHGFTHFPLSLTLLAGRTEAPPDGLWARPDQFKDHAFPTLTKKVVKHALSVLRGG
jgi:A/G-specific adenine glycosylase